LKAELESTAAAHDGATSDPQRRMLNITRDTGELLGVLVRATGARRILEIGTSNGYSTLWLAEAARQTGGSTTTVELSEWKAKLAAENFARAGLSALITLVVDDAGHLLQRTGPGAYDFVFLDSERSEYCRWWPHLRRALASRALLVVDNAIHPRPEELSPFIDLVKADGAFATSLVPIGKGEFLAVKA
jgi:predicted O-methyltransferase YrrM